jgi:cytochrome c peroxidase
MSSFADPENMKDPFNRPVSVGSDGMGMGNRNTPSAAYAAFVPNFHFDTTEGIYFGGLFLDGSATGATLGDPLAEQAQGPFVNSVEMGLADKQAVIASIQAAPYGALFEEVFGPGAFENIDTAYDNMARAVAAVEKTNAFRRFNSKFDELWTKCKEQGIDLSTVTDPNAIGNLPQGILTELELRGLALFNNSEKGNCAACHPTTDVIDGSGNVLPPMFTDHSYDNLGIPINPRVGQLRAAAGLETGIDYGLGARSDVIAEREDGALMPDGLGNEVMVSTSQAGLFRVSSLRNVGKTAPYGHNGFFATLQDVLHFYNTRDVSGSDWGSPEVSLNVNDEELGDLGLTRDEEHAILAFMMTLSDTIPEESASYDRQTGVLLLPAVSWDTTEIFKARLTGPWNILELSAQ